MKETKKILTTASQMNEEYLCTDVLRPELEAEYRNVANMYKRFKDANILAIIRDGSYLGDIFITQIEKKGGVPSYFSVLKELRNRLESKDWDDRRVAAIWRQAAREEAQWAAAKELRVTRTVPLKDGTEVTIDLAGGEGYCYDECRDDVWLYLKFRTDRDEFYYRYPIWGEKFAKAKQAFAKACQEAKACTSQDIRSHMRDVL